MISGIVLLQPSKLQEDYKTFYKKRFTTVVIPFIFAVALYVGLDYVRIGADFNWLQATKDIINIGYYYHLWYVAFIIGLYLIIPFLRVLIQHIDHKLLRLYLYFWAGFQFLNLIITAFFDTKR